MDVVVGNCLKAFAGQLSVLADLATDLLARAKHEVILFSSNQQIAPGSDLSTFTQASFPGYAPKNVASFTPPSIDGAGNAFMCTPLLNFTHSGGVGGNNIYSAALMGTNAAGVAATATAHETGGVIDSVTLVTPGSGYVVPPIVVIAGAPGVNAVVRATIAGGAVTGFVIDNGGSGYVAPTATVDAPTEMIAFANFLNPRPMNIATDSLPLIMQINQGS